DDSDIALANQWDMCNFVVFTWIINSLSPDLYAGAIYAKYAYELWNDPKETYDNQFDAMFLMGLDDNSMATRSNILTTEPLPLVKAAFAIVSGEESHRNITSIIGNAASKSPVSLSNEQLTRLMNLLNDNGVSSANANMSDKNSLNFKVTFFNGSVKFNINFQRYFNGKVDFVVGLTVGHLNETRALITKIGDLKLNDNITLYDVLVVPRYTVSLLSVHKLSRDNKMFTGFNENNACKTVSNCSISSCFVSRTLRHQRLGHPADLALDVLKGSLNLDSQTTPEHICDTCNKAKQTREPFPLSDHKSSKIGELLHLDV
nr:ribonuclease H-like domain-containing protein [Tanacetum cinerariifolium]